MWSEGPGGGHYEAMASKSYQYVACGTSQTATGWWIVQDRATVATPLAWAELDTTAPDAFTIANVDRLVERPDSLAELAARPGDGESFVAAIEAAFEGSGLVLETFDRFRS